MDYNNMDYNSESREPINYKMPSKGLYTFLMIVGWFAERSGARCQSRRW